MLPAVLLFMPYRLLTGHMLSSGAAVLLLMLLAILFLALLVIRVIARIAPKTSSLAATSIALTTMLLGSNAGYLLFRRNFYSVPFAASLALRAHWESGCGLGRNAKTPTIMPKPGGVAFAAVVPPYAPSTGGRWGMLSRSR